jgi:putative MATE family efflux protein
MKPSASVLPVESIQQAPRERLARAVLLLALPVVAEQFLHSIVGTTDTWMANHLLPVAAPDAPAVNAAAGAAVGTVQYVLWFIGMVAGAIGTGATAIISRSVGARDRRSANAACGQTVTLALVVGLFVGATLFFVAPWFVQASRLQGQAADFFIDYTRLLSLAMPLTLLMFAAGAALRGAGDTLSPAIAMIVVDIVNLFFTIGLTYGRFGMPTLGFRGIAAGTIIAYAVGGVLLLIILLRRKGFMRLRIHRMKPDWVSLRRILRIGIPNGTESALQWVANFAVLGGVNTLGNASAAAHANAIRLESFSFLTGMGFATAASTLVGQSLGKRDPKRARRATYLAYAMGGGFMTLAGAVYVGFADQLAALMSNDQDVMSLTAGAIRTAGYVQCGFAAAMIFGFAMRGAGDTLKVMIVNLSSIVGIRFVGVLVAVYWLGGGLQHVWYVLCGELMLCGILMFARFRLGRWDQVKV